MLPMAVRQIEAHLAKLQDEGRAELPAPSDTRPPPPPSDGWLGPEARLLERHESRVAAPPERAYEAIQQVRLAEMPIVRVLFTMRRIPYSKGMTLREFFGTPPFLILEE